MSGRAFHILPLVVGSRKFITSQVALQSHYHRHHQSINQSISQSITQLSPFSGSGAVMQHKKRHGHWTRYTRFRQARTVATVLIKYVHAIENTYRKSIVVTFDSFRRSLKTHLLATEAPSDSFDLGAIQITVSIYLSIYLSIVIDIYFGQMYNMIRKYK